MPLTLPKHIAVIMDGNGRWAKAKGLPRLQGHARGVETADAIVTAVRERKIPFLTLYAFSDENWHRPDEEVAALMELLDEYLKRKQEKMFTNGICFETIGDISKLPENIQKRIAETKKITVAGKNMTLILALSYGARNEWVRTVNKILSNGNKQMTEEDFAKHLDTHNIPDPDLLIRTGGEYRLSNFLLWQMAYTELYFTKTMWPDFTPEELNKALKEFSKRERRFGKTSEQLGGE